MKNTSYFYLRVTLRADERDALMQLSRSERRDPRAQAAMLIRRALENAGYLKNELTEPARMDAPQDETRSDQLAPARISPNEHAEIDAARSLVGESESEFVRNAALERAREINR